MFRKLLMARAQYETALELEPGTEQAREALENLLE
jgi:hypothetical protein